MSYFVLAFEFFKTGMFSIGGGLATLPFLIEFAKRYDVLKVSDLLNMISISESTPGPLGVNVATYVGFNLKGVIGAICATLAIVLPSYIIICLVSLIFEKFSDSKFVKSALNGIKPVVCALIFGALLQIFSATFLSGKLIDYKFNHKNLVIGAAFFIIMFIPKLKKLHPVFWVIIGALVGIIFKL